MTMTTSAPRPPRSTVNVDSIPQELKGRPQWAAFRYGLRDGTWTKIPKQPNGENAKTNDPSTWSSFDDALAAYNTDQTLDGIGYIFAEDDPYCGVDIDKLRATPERMVWALGIIKRIGTYAEWSVSGNGLHAIGKGRMPDAAGTPQKGRNDRKKGLEAYSRRRFFTFTGKAVEGAPTAIVDVQPALDWLLANEFKSKDTSKLPVHEERSDNPIAATGRTNGHAVPKFDKNIVFGRVMDPKNLSDDDVIALVSEAKNGAKFRRLWNGDTSDYRSVSKDRTTNDGHSEADAALLGILAFYVRGDRHRMDTLFRKSRLYRDKWERADYRDSTMDLALDGQTKFYGDGVSKDFPWLDELKDGPIVMPAPTTNGHAPSQAPKPAPRPAANIQALLAEISLRGDAPQIDAGNLDLRVVTTQAWNAIDLANQQQPFIFKHGGIPVWVGRDDEGRATLGELTQSHIRHILARVAVFFQVKIKKTTDDEGEEHQTKSKKVTLPPTHVCTDVLATPDPDLPVIARLIECPVFAPDGTLQTEPGYHAAGRVYLAISPGLNIPEVALAPSADDIQRAKALIVDDLLGDFPFAGPAELANAVALALEQFVRDMIDGPLPLHSFEAPTPGSGKGLLADALLRPSCGRTVGAISQARDDDEWRKRILAALAQGYPAIQIDNANKPIESGALSMALTIPVFTDRILGSTKMLSVPVRCSWVVTANNPTYSTEMARRTVRTRIDPKVDRPQDREGFRHPELLSWVDDNRGELIWAFCTLIRAWVAAGKPKFTGKALGSFERWSHVIGGILQTVGIPGFLDNQATFYDVADAETAAWRSFVGAWWDMHRDKEVGAATLFPLALQTDGIDLGGGQDGSKSQKTRFGMLLGAQRDRVIGGYRVVAGGVSHKAKQWRLLPTDPGNLGNLDEPFDTPPHVHTRDTERDTDSKTFPQVPQVPPSSADATELDCFGCGSDRACAGGYCAACEEARL